MKKNLKIVLREEIALEGLDGITFQALWLRISEATSTKLPFSERFKEYLWKLIKIMPIYDYFELEEPRPDLVLFNRFSSKDVPDDIYPHSPISDTKNNIKGSCSSYHTRKNITDRVKSLNYEDIDKHWGSKFVIVADQKVREEILLDQKGPISNISVMRYCMLERIGRSRYSGEISHGQNSLMALGEEPKKLFYHRKTLLEENIIKKQICNKKGKNYQYNGTLLHLKRFYTEGTPKFLKLTEMAVEYLKKKKNNIALYEEIKTLLHLKNFKKLRVLPEFLQYIELDIYTPYREIFPDASEEEWQLKAHKRERLLHIVKLKDPNATVETSKKPEPATVIGNHSKYFQDIKVNLNQPLLTQCCLAVRSFGTNGCSETELRHYLGLPRLTTRILIRNLERRNMLASFLIDDGRQRINRYCYREFENSGEMAEKFNLQRKETLELFLDNLESTSNNSDNSDIE